MAAIGLLRLTVSILVNQPRLQQYRNTERKIIKNNELLQCDTYIKLHNFMHNAGVDL